MSPGKGIQRQSQNVLPIGVTVSGTARAPLMRHRLHAQVRGRIALRSSEIGLGTLSSVRASDAFCKFSWISSKGLAGTAKRERGSPLGPHMRDEPARRG